jgi:four helix bundle protein
VRDYHGLLVWRRAHALVIAVRKVTQRMRYSDQATLRSQLTRAAESVPANIAEGCFAASQKEFARFLDISIKSSGELEYHLELGRDYGVLSESSWRTLSTEVKEVRAMLVGLRRRVLSQQSRISRS